MHLEYPERAKEYHSDNCCGDLKIIIMKYDRGYHDADDYGCKHFEIFKAVRKIVYRYKGSVFKPFYRKHHQFGRKLLIDK